MLLNNESCVCNAHVFVIINCVSADFTLLKDWNEKKIFWLHLPVAIFFKFALIKTAVSTVEVKDFLGKGTGFGFFPLVFKITRFLMNLIRFTQINLTLLFLFV